MNNSINYSSFIDLIREQDPAAPTSKYSTRDIAHDDNVAVPDHVHEDHRGNRKSKSKKQNKHP